MLFSLSSSSSSSLFSALAERERGEEDGILAACEVKRLLLPPSDISAERGRGRKGTGMLGGFAQFFFCSSLLQLGARAKKNPLLLNAIILKIGFFFGRCTYCHFGPDRIQKLPEVVGVIGFSFTLFNRTSRIQALLLSPPPRRDRYPTTNGGRQCGSSVGTPTHCMHGVFFARLAPICVLSR